MVTQFLDTGSDSDAAQGQITVRKLGEVRAVTDQDLLELMESTVRARNQLDHALAILFGEADRRGWSSKHGRRLVDLGRYIGLSPNVAARVLRNARRAGIVPRLEEDAAQGRIGAEVFDAAAGGMAAISKRSPQPLNDEQRDEYERVLQRHTMSGATPHEITAFAREIGNELAGASPDAATPVNEDSSLNSCEIGQTAEGRTSITADVDVMTGELVASALIALAKPRPDADGNPDPRTSTQRRADALAELVRRAGSSAIGLPQRAQLMVTVPADRPDTSRLSWMGPITARVLAQTGCDADIVVAGLDAHGVPLSLGRTQRLFSDAQKKAMRLRDGGCVKCGAPPQWTDAHHVEYWEDGGPTDLASGALLCRPCHRDVHHHGWEIVMGRDRCPWLKPPVSVDPQRHLIRSYNRRTLTLAA